MKEKSLLALALFLLVFFETTISYIPILVGAFVLFAVYFKSEWVIIAAFFCGIIFDILTLRQIGGTSIFLTLLTFLIYVYQNKFEIQNVKFIFLSVTIASFLFLACIDASSFLAPAIFTGLVCVLIFQLMPKQIVLE